MHGLRTACTCIHVILMASVREIERKRQKLSWSAIIDSLGSLCRMSQFTARTISLHAVSQETDGVRLFLIATRNISNFSDWYSIDTVQWVTPLPLLYWTCLVWIHHTRANSCQWCIMYFELSTFSLNYGGIIPYTTAITRSYGNKPEPSQALLVGSSSFFGYIYSISWIFADWNGHW